MNSAVQHLIHKTRKKAQETLEKEIIKAAPFMAEQLCNSLSVGKNYRIERDEREQMIHIIIPLR